jgi:hypothetical protein
MTAKSRRKLTCVLVDAVIVIEAHRLGLWHDLIKKVRVVVPATVVQDEAFYFKTRSRRKHHAIALGELVEDGRIVQEAATVEELRGLRTIFDDVTLQGLHAGELEALALLQAGRVEDTPFCTSDALAIRALAVMGRHESGISLERMLQRLGLQTSLESQYTEDYFRDHLKRGMRDRITRAGLRR